MKRALVFAAALWISLVMSCGRAAAAEDNVTPLFPFVLPWDDSAPGVTDLSGWLHAPAGKDGFVHAGTDGHLYAGETRIRFFGVNFCYGANFPRTNDADKIAARLAKFGINVVRFHHMDAQPFPNGIRARADKSTRALDPEALDRLDHLVAALKRRGIYANLNLLVSRPFNAADGLPPEIEQVVPKDRATIGFFYAPLRELQQEYARKLLTHRNVETGFMYAEEPAVAFVEINNENGLAHSWLGGQLDNLPGVFARDWQRQWNEWLQKRYRSTQKLRAAWGAMSEPLGEEMLATNIEHWALERQQAAEATESLVEDVSEALRGQKAARIDVSKPGGRSWHVQFNRSGLKLQSGQPYTLTFWARTDREREISACVGQAQAPWENLGLSSPVSLTTQWQQFHFTFSASESDDNARVGFSDLGKQTGAYWFAGVSLRPSGVIGLTQTERIEDSTLPAFTRAHWGERTPEAQRDWMRFLAETEGRYWQSMDRFLKDDLHVHAVVMGTIVGCSTPELMAKFDAIDTHAYWQHPQFPARQWDSENWFVPNLTMVNERGGTLSDLALHRVLGKPHSVTEYNHPAPNTYSSEAFLLLSAYAALQDWDAIYAFAWSHRRDDWDTQHITSFSDIDQHPTKLVTLPAAVAIFMRGDVTAAREQIVATLDPAHAPDLLRKSRAWSLISAQQLGVPREAALLRRVAINVTRRAASHDQVPSAVTTNRLVSDTGELAWDVSEKGCGIVTVNTVKSKAVIGFGGGKRFELSGFVIEPGPTRQNGWSAITATEAQPRRWLITATGYVENTDMQWKNSEHSSVGRNWGNAPSLVEGIPARITLPLPAKEVEAWTLDERGQRKTKLAVDPDAGGHAVLVIGPQHKTLWYEVTTK